MTKSLLSTEWITQLGSFKTLIVGFSGGLDSTVLLHALATQSSLRDKLTAVHINHGISPNALVWQKHSEEMCSNLGIKFFSESVQFDRSSNLEEGARNARYQVFSSLLQANDCLILGHHLDDQAETVLLQLFRGAGVDGLSAMTEISPLGAGVLARPFLFYSREQLEHYASIHGLKWIEDESNMDIAYSRNFLRQQVMPMLVSKWPGVAGNIARAAGHCQDARSNLDELALNDCPELLTLSNSLLITPIKSLSFERIANVLRVWLKRNQIRSPSAATFQRIIHEVLFAGLDAMPLVSWDKVHIRRYQERLYIVRRQESKLPACIEWPDFPNPVTHTGIHLKATKSKEGIRIPPNAKIQIKFRQGGELFFLHGQRKQLKKLFQEWGIPPWLRDTIPLVYINEQLAAVGEHAFSDLFFTKKSSEAWLLSFNTKYDG